MSKVHIDDSMFFDIINEILALTADKYEEKDWDSFRHELKNKIPSHFFPIMEKHLMTIQSLKEKEKNLRFSKKTFELFHQINIEVSTLAPLEETLSLSADRLRTISKASIALIALTDKGGKTIRIKTQSGSTTDELVNFEQATDIGVGGLAAKYKKPFVVSDFELEQDILDPLSKHLIEKEGIRSIIGSPLFVNKEFIGVVFLARRQPYTSSTLLLNMLTSFCYQTAIAIDNARLYANELKVSTLHQELFEEALNQGYSGVIQKLSKFINTPILLMDDFGNTIFEFFPENFPEKSSINGFFDHSLIYKKIQYENKSFQSRIEIFLGNDSFFTAFPIFLYERTVAYLIIPHAFEKQDYLDIIAIEQSKNVLALKINQERTSMEVENRLRQDYLYDLILGLESEDDLLRRGRYLKFFFRVPHQIIILSPNDESNTHTIENKQMDQSLEKIRYLLGISALPLSMVHGQKLIIIVPSEKTESVAKDILSYFNEHIPMIISTLGISNLVQDPGDYVRGYEEAKKAAEFAKLFRKSNQIVYYEDLGIIGVLFETNNFDSMKAFMEKYLGALLEYDSKRNSDLIKSLQVFLDNESVIQASADKLHVHYNTLRYRLNRIRDITALDLKDPQDRLNIQISLTIHQLLHS